MCESHVPHRGQPLATKGQKDLVESKSCCKRCVERSMMRLLLLPGPLLSDLTPVQPLC